MTRILREVSAGMPGARERLLRAVYGELKSIARKRLARFPQPAQEALQPTELVHEAYLRLFAGENVTWNDRQHFYATAATAMLQCLLDQARRRRRAKRGRLVALVWEAPDALHDPDAILALSEAIERLESYNPLAAQVVRYRYVLGMTEEEIGLELAISRKTVNNKWRFAQAWLRRSLESSSE